MARMTPMSLLLPALAAHASGGAGDSLGLHPADRTEPDHAQSLACYLGAGEFLFLLLQSP